MVVATETALGSCHGSSGFATPYLLPRFLDTVSQPRGWVAWASVQECSLISSDTGPTWPRAASQAERLKLGWPSVQECPPTAARA